MIERAEKARIEELVVTFANSLKVPHCGNTSKDTKVNKLTTKVQDIISAATVHTFYLFIFNLLFKPR